MVMDGGVAECFMEIILNQQQLGNLECLKEEHQKIAEQFSAAQMVRDKCPFRISCRFVLWYKKHSNNTIQVRTRLVTRGWVGGIEAVRGFWLTQNHC